MNILKRISSICNHFPLKGDGRGSLILMLLCAALAVQAQPKVRRQTDSNSAAQTGKTTKSVKASDRAALMFPTKDAMPEDVCWRRDVYRTLDLTKDANAPLYYPVEPQGRQVNLFTYIFRLMLTKRVNAYTYKLDGVESFDNKDKMDVKDVLDRYSIYYEEKDGKYTVENNDVPSAEVTRYYLKESVYLDQRTGTFSTKVTALCPVLMRGGDDFGGEATPYPLFWLNYDEVAPWLAKLPMMASNYNNVTNMTADDYFTMNRYDGKIYKTNNMQGKALANYCKTDSAMNAEQAKIEKQISDFENKVYGHMTHEDSLKAAREDSINLAKQAAEKGARKSLFGRSSTTTGRRTTTTSARTTRTTKTASSTSRRTAGASKPKAAKSSSGGNNASRITVRRQRR